MSILFSKVSNDYFLKKKKKKTGNEITPALEIIPLVRNKE
jgi:hypothetical protein